MNISLKTPYPCPECGRRLRFYEGLPGYFDCECGYMRTNGDAE